MRCLRIGSYQPFSLSLVRRHARLLAFCLIAALPWLLFLAERKLIAAGALFAVFLALLAVLDGYYGFLYDKLLLPLGTAGLCLAALGAIPRSLGESLLSALAAGALFAALRFFSRGGMGWGDVKFVAVLGLWLGLRGTAVAVFLAIALGGAAAVFLLARGRDKRSALPFGPFLSLGAYAAYIFGAEIWQWYEEMVL